MIVPFEGLPADAIGVAGGKGASLARMAAAGLPVPRGFVVCAAAFEPFMARHAGADLVLEVTDGLDVHDAAALEAASNRLRDVIVTKPMPEEIQDGIRQAYRRLGGERADGAEAGAGAQPPV